MHAKHAAPARHVATPLPRWQRLGVYGLGFALLLSGVVWLYLEHFVRVDAEFGPEHHPAQHIMLVSHGLLAMPMLWLSGVLWTAHIKRHWHYRINRSSGVVLAVSIVLMAITAGGLYYLSSDNTRAWASVLHWVFGIAGGFLLVLHVGLGRRKASG